MEFWLRKLTWNCQTDMEWEIMSQSLTNLFTDWNNHQEKRSADIFNILYPIALFLPSLIHTFIHPQKYRFKYCGLTQAIAKKLSKKDGGRTLLIFFYAYYSMYKVAIWDSISSHVPLGRFKTCPSTEVDLLTYDGNLKSYVGQTDGSKPVRGVP